MNKETERIYDEHYYLIQTLNSLAVNVLNKGMISEFMFKSIVKNGLSDTEIVIEGINDEE